MLFDNLPLSLPWYNDIAKQDRFKLNVAQDAIFCQLAPNDGLLPFQFRKDAASAFPASWTIRCMQRKPLEWYNPGGNEDPVIADLSHFIVPALHGETLDGEDVITFIQSSNALNILLGSTLGDVLPPGIYYMQMDFLDPGIESFYSEIFRVPEDGFDYDSPGSTNYLTFKWKHSSDIRPIHYGVDYGVAPDGYFYNKLILDSIVTASEPILDIEIQKDGKNEPFATFQKAIIKYHVTAFVPDYLKIALHLMEIHDWKYLVDVKGIREGEIKNLEVTSSLANDGAQSVVEILFEQMVLISSTNCEDNMTEPEGESFFADTPFVLTTGFCEPSGDISVSLTGGPASGPCYGELWGDAGAGYVLAYSHIDISAMTTHGPWVGNVGPATGFTHFKIKFRTFTFYVTLESSVSVPTATC